MMRAWFVLGILLTSTYMVSCKDVCNRYDVNGCSTPLKMPFFFKGRFTHACNRHDVCYRCGDKYGIPREVCDLDFFNTMKKTCTSLRRRRSADDFRNGHIEKRGLRRNFCKLFARGYYAVVKRFGRSRYRIPSTSYCDETWWVLPCLPRIYNFKNKLMAL